MSKDTGGLAFPIKESYPINPGMTLRDWFAGQALASVLSNNQLLDDLANGKPEDKMASLVSGLCYSVADAMLNARK